MNIQVRNHRQPCIGNSACDVCYIGEVRLRSDYVKSGMTDANVYVARLSYRQAKRVWDNCGPLPSQWEVQGSRVCGMFPSVDGEKFILWWEVV